eukprot:m.245923 g.245923  ORF g.245923 m.245923 type:complete len:405 (-) comp19478_c1_seq2:225-1439(-)
MTQFFQLFAVLCVFKATCGARISSDAVDRSSTSFASRSDYIKKVYIAENNFSEDQVSAMVEQEAHRTSLRQSTSVKDLVRACDAIPLSGTTPTSVFEVRPCDLDAVGAIGDSLTTADNADSTSWLNMRQYPGLSWSMGGDSDRVTMPNILNEICEKSGKTTSIIGRSTGSGNNKIFHLNAAVSGAISINLPGQATDLVEKFKTVLGDTGYETQWKHATVLIGGNDLCQVCIPSQLPKHDDTVFQQSLRSTLAAFQDVPRLIVSVVAHLDYTQLSTFVDKLGCRLTLPGICDCLSTEQRDKLELAREYVAKFNAALEQEVMVFNDNVRDRQDIRAVVQPFAIKTNITTAEFISDADCFHPSELGQEVFGIGLWNNMIQSVASKANAIDLANPEVQCPTRDSRIFT